MLDYKEREAELKEEIEAWRGLNKYIVKRAKRDLRDLNNSRTTNAYFSEYKSKNMEELNSIAKKLGVPQYYDLKEENLIKEIMKRE